ncbi:hypothetical protein BV898_11838 [Hypsibius exemplaris]|uniref:WAP domain-containing protein n=1 Tax=Hypsibius exemplaris TaxID=2072580 RepID=A0A1W0WFG5_HYPEX|nr:hypothetical protein BV898_11838 [Hypsibius exemplaris]
MSAKIYLVLFLAVVVVVQYTEAASKHCTWHGTAPACFPDCPSDKFAIKENNCGKAKIACCVTGKKKLCCPKTLKGQITAAQAEAMAD